MTLCMAGTGSDGQERAQARGQVHRAAWSGNGQGGGEVPS